MDQNQSQTKNANELLKSDKKNEVLSIDTPITNFKLEEKKFSFEFEQPRSMNDIKDFPENLRIKSRKQSFKEEYVKALDEMLPKSTNFRFDLAEHEASSKSVSHNLEKIKIIAVCGGAASGKSFIIKSIKHYLRNLGYKPTTIRERNFLLKIPGSEENLSQEVIKNYDFDHYNAIDWKLFEEAIKTLSESRPFDCPVYSIFDNQPSIITKKLEPSNVILLEGRLFLNNDYIRNRCNFKIYLDTDQDIILSRTIIKNQKMKNIPLEEIISKYTQFIKPNFEKYVEPSKKYADMIIFNFAGEYINPEEQKKEFEFLNMIKDWLNFKIKETPSFQ